MSLRHNLLAFGISTAAIVGGGYGLNQALDYKSEHVRQITCLDLKYAGELACKHMFVTPEIANSTHETQIIYSWIAGAGLLGGAIGLGLSFVSTLEGSESQERPTQQVDIEA